MMSRPSPSSGQSLSEPSLEIGSLVLQRSIEEVIRRVKPAGFIRLQVVDIAVFENAGGKRQLLSGLIDQQRAFYELAAIIAGEDAFAAKVKMNPLKPFVVDDALVWRID